MTLSLAAKQSLYNGFLAAGLVWTFFITDPLWKKNVAIFFLICVSTAGIFIGISASKKIFFSQALPALLALIGLLIFR
ncbi:MAG: DUF1304 domain-containing protein [Sphingobacteriaceae bacterium]